RSARSGGARLQARGPGDQPVARHDPTPGPGARAAARSAGSIVRRTGQRARIEIRTLLKRLGTMGKTIMVSSHILPELADICNKIGIIERGELVFNDTVDALLKKVRPHTVLNIGVAGDRQDAAQVLRRN